MKTKSAFLPTFFPIITAAIAFSIGSTSVNAQSAYYKVTSTLTEHLNVRQKPAAASDDIGDLQPGSQPFEILEVDASGEWGRIQFQETTGWVALDFMEPIELTHLADTVVPIGLLCAGTEPFWTIEIKSAEQAILSTQEAVTPMSLANIEVSRNRSELPVALELITPDYTAITVLNRQACSDGLTNINYTWAADIVMQPELDLLSGCCIVR